MGGSAEGLGKSPVAPVSYCCRRHEQGQSEFRLDGDHAALDLPLHAELGRPAACAPAAKATKAPQRHEFTTWLSKTTLLLAHKPTQQSSIDISAGGSMKATKTVVVVVVVAAVVGGGGGGCSFFVQHQAGSCFRWSRFFFSKTPPFCLIFSPRDDRFACRCFE